VWITFVTVGELAKWAEVRSWGAPARARLDTWIAARGVIPYDEEVARTCGWLAARAQRRGRPRPQNDMWVAACCLRHRIPLITLNVSDFEDFATHDGLQLVRESPA
jgi:predicted nucleic acid-binding protein